ncbi:hypothetical protein D3C72_259790 [compost metagenome]
MAIAGPRVNFIPGYISSRTCAITCEVECQNAFFPPSSFHVYKIRLPSVVKGVVVSTMVPLKEAEITFLANPSLMLLATSMGVIPGANSLTDPSGKVILIIFYIFRNANIGHCKNTYKI